MTPSFGVSSLLIWKAQKLFSPASSFHPLDLFRVSLCITSEVKKEQTGMRWDFIHQLGFVLTFYHTCVFSWRIDPHVSWRKALSPSPQYKSSFLSVCLEVRHRFSLSESRGLDGAFVAREGVVPAWFIFAFGPIFLKSMGSTLRKYEDIGCQVI